MTKKFTERPCEWCGKIFEPSNPTQTCCSAQCDQDSADQDQIDADAAMLDYEQD